MIELKNKVKTTTVKNFLKMQGLSSRTLTQLAKEYGTLKVENCILNMKSTIYKNQILQINYVEKYTSTNIPVIDKPINVVYEDDYILIVDKPPCIPTTPSFSYDDSLAGRVLNYLGKCTFRALNRLDADTSGCVIIAKDVITENLLEKNGKIKKYYLALVEGKTKWLGKIDAPIKDDGLLKRRIVAKDGLPAITYYKRLKYHKSVDCSLVKCRLKFGRTNQIRCHLSYIGHSLIYDTKYQSTHNQGKFYLRCYKVYFIHPYTNKKILINLSPNLPKL